MNHAAAGIEIATVRSDKLGQPSGGGRFSIHDITFDDIVSATYRRDGAPLLIANNWSSNALNNVRIDHVTGFGDVGHAFDVRGDFASLPKIAGLVFTNNILFAGPTPSGPLAGPDNCAIRDIAMDTFDACFSTYAFSNDALIAPFVSYYSYPGRAGKGSPGEGRCLVA